MDFNSYSLEESVSNIDNSKTQVHFSEVLKCYSNGCYRSATVMLWSVVVADAIFKLRTLSDVYGDSSAQKILSEIEEEQEKDPASSKWERTILRSLFERTKLLSTIDLQKLETIQKHRHLSGHPILTEESILFEPTPEMVRSDIRNALDVILTRSALLNKNIVGKLVVDLESVKDLFPIKSELKTYIESKYLRSVSPSILVHIFRALWKFVFIIRSDKCKENLAINYRALEIVYESGPGVINDDIRTDGDYYSNISESSESLSKLVIFLSDKREIYFCLKDSARLVIEKKIKQSFTLQAISFFLSETSEVHVENLISTINEKYKCEYGVNKIFVNKEHHPILDKFFSETGRTDLKNAFRIACYVNSVDFERADVYFDRYIKNYLSEFNAEEISLLLDGCNENSQVHWDQRRRANNEMISILNSAKSLKPTLDLNQYSNLPVHMLG